MLPTYTNTDVWICLPAFNEQEKLAEVIDDVKACGFTNICVIDDGSTDGTATIARRRGTVMVSHPINRGAGAAVMTAIALARRRQWPLLAFMDADGQHMAQDLIRLVESMQTRQTDLMIGSRFLKPNLSIPRSRYFLNQFANTLTNFFCRGNYSDSQSGMRVLNQHAINSLNLTIDGFGFCSEMLLAAERLNLRIGETPISVRYTQYSISKGQDLQLGFQTALNFLWNLLFR